MPEPKLAQIEHCLEHAETRMLQAEFADAENEELLYQEATDLLIEAETIMKGSGAWLMAGLHARRGNGKMCVQWLERARGASMLPAADEIRDHIHFTKAKSKDWLKQWLEQLP